MACTATAALGARNFVASGASPAAYAGRDLLQNLPEGQGLRGQLHCPDGDVYAADGVCV
jgi:hypothetical protein